LPVNNRFATSGADHASITRDLPRQIRALPDGTALRLKIVP